MHNRSYSSQTFTSLAFLFFFQVLISIPNFRRLAPYAQQHAKMPSPYPKENPDPNPLPLLIGTFTLSTTYRYKGPVDPAGEDQGKDSTKCLSLVHIHCQQITCHGQQPACISLISLFSALTADAVLEVLLVAFDVPYPFQLYWNVAFLNTISAYAGSIFISLSKLVLTSTFCMSLLR